MIVTFYLHVNDLHFLLSFFSSSVILSHCEIHIQILFKSVAPYLHMKLRIWSHVACILIRGTTFTAERVDIANKWERVLIIVMKWVVGIVHQHHRVFSSHVMNILSFSTPLLSAQEIIILSSNREALSWCHFLKQNYPQDGSLFTHYKPLYFAAKKKKQKKHKLHIMLFYNGHYLSILLWMWNHVM